MKPESHSPHELATTHIEVVMFIPTMKRLKSFVNGLLHVIQPLVLRFRGGKPQYDLKFYRVVSFARNEGDSHRAFRSRTSVNSILPTSKPVLARAH